MDLNVVMSGFRIRMEPNASFPSKTQSSFSPILEKIFFCSEPFLQNLRPPFLNTQRALISADYLKHLLLQTELFLM